MSVPFNTKHLHHLVYALSQMEFLRKDLLWNDFLNEEPHPGIPLPFSSGEDPFAPAPTYYYPLMDYTLEGYEYTHPSACINPMYTLGMHHPSFMKPTTLQPQVGSSLAIDPQLQDAPTPSSNTSRDSTPPASHGQTQESTNGPASLVPASLAAIFATSSATTSPMAIAVASTPQRKSASTQPKRRRTAPYPTSSTSDTSMDTFTVQDGLPVLVVENPGELPPTTVYTLSSPDEITSEATRLSRRLRHHILSSVAHHPCMTCPVFDCPLGGWNTLLHGPYPTSKAKAYGKTGKFFTTNEILRHVRSKHTPPTDLRCEHPGCATQKRLDEKKSNATGTFSRLDVFKAHLKEHPTHKHALSEELKDKYGL